MKKQFKETVVVASFEYEGKTYYACRGRETGMGRTTERTEDIRSADTFGDPVGIMYAYGGHYTGYVPKEVIVTKNYEITDKVLTYPPREEVWD